MYVHRGRENIGVRCIGILLKRLNESVEIKVLISEKKELICSVTVENPMRKLEIQSYISFLQIVNC